MRPIRAQEARPHVGHMCVDAGSGLEVKVALALRMARLFCATLLCLISVVRAPDDSFPHHAERSWASVSHGLRSMYRLLRDALRRSFKRFKPFFCPPTERLP